jgi:hypothetical protein
MTRYSMVAAFLLLAASSAHAQKWELGENTVGVAIAGAEWTISQDFPGTKIIFDGQYAFSRKPGQVNEERRCCKEPNTPEHLIGLVDAHLQWGLGDTGLEYAIVGVTPWATQWESDAEPQKGIKAARDIVEWLAFQTGYDDPLGVDNYTTLSFARGGRVWRYKWADQSPWSVLFGFQASLGWNWAQSIEPTYDNVSTPFIGMFLDLAISHEKWGMIYTDDRTVNGFTLSNPTRGGATAREARIRFGYFNQFYRCLAIDAFLEKRSMYFADDNQPTLYTNSKRYGAELQCRFK